ncbi:hypothetical protein VTK26DRAFT_6182 [Humicola hyalothermophila]
MECRSVAHLEAQCEVPSPDFSSSASFIICGVVLLRLECSWQLAANSLCTLVGSTDPYTGCYPSTMYFVHVLHDRTAPVRKLQRAETHGLR